MWTAKFWKDLAERAVKSAAQGVLLFWAGDEVFNAWHADWGRAGGIALGAAVLSALSSIVSRPVTDSSSASLVDLR